MTKCAVIFYHKNIDQIYKKEWIEKCINSVKNQTYQNFDVFELDYGGTDNKKTEGIKGKTSFFSIEKENHISAMNFLIDYVFGLGYDVIFNTNMDDYYHTTRFEKQLKSIYIGNQLVSSNFYYFSDKQGIFKQMNMAKFNISHEINKNHNPIAHPVIAIHKSFWEGLRYNNFLGYEDLDLWKRAEEAGKKMIILPEYLLYYRIHDNQITKKFKGL